MLNLNITFDYELFFNDTDFNEEEVLIKPTDLICNLLDKYNIQGTFFVDMSCLFRYSQLGLNDFPDMVEAQIVRLLKKGHDVQLHIHPHWYTSDFVNGKWNIDNTHYSLSSLDKKEALEIVKREKEALERILKKESTDYECTAYRAGGFCIHPIEQSVEILKESHIKIDSSICRGLYLNDGIRYNNFRGMPAECNFYLDELSGKTQKTVYEVPVGTVENRLFKLLIWKVMPRLNRGKLKGKPTPSFVLENKVKKFIHRIRAAWAEPVLLSLDGLHYKSMIAALKYLSRKYRCKKNQVYLAVICHPKFMTEAVYNNMDSFFEAVKNDLPDVRFTTMNKIHSQLSRI